jgi:hypothetical protein
LLAPSSPGLDEAAALGLTERDVWIASNPHYDRPTAGWLSRSTLRELGHGEAIDRLVAVGKCPVDWLARLAEPIHTSPSNVGVIDHSPSAHDSSHQARPFPRQLQQ